MKRRLAWTLILTQTVLAYAEVIFIRRTENQSVELSCSPEQSRGTPTAFHLYHSRIQSQVTLLSMAEGSELRINPEHRGRLQVSGRLDSPQVNVTIPYSQHTDTGLYSWELTYRAQNSSDQSILSSQQVFLLVETTGRPCQCSARYPSLLYAIFTGVGLLLLLFIWLCAEQCARARKHHKPQPPVAIYEDMHSKPRGIGSPQNNHEGPSHLEEAVYANPNIKQAQNHYACPRQTTLGV
ncbi:uncharacterized protein ACJ7VT_021438 [Polymixia lowei]